MRAQLTITTVLALASHASADVIDVPADQPTIQAGIDAASNGDEVVVAPGTYAEIVDMSGKAIVLRSSGGAAVTTIDATTVTDPGTGKPVVRFDSGEGFDTIVEGFTLTGGTGDTGWFETPIGGGVFVTSATATVRDCIIEGNSAEVGGGVLVFEGSIALNGCVIEANSAVTAGGLYAATGELTMADTTVCGNVALGSSGGVELDLGDVTAVVVDSLFEGNVAGNSGAGGGINSNAASLTIERCAFEGNLAGNNGGGINASGDMVWISESTFVSNHSDSGGGAVRMGAANYRIANCVFSQNTSDFSGGALYLSNGVSDDVLNCAFSGNGAASGSVLYTTTPSMQLANCVIWGNEPGDPHFGGPHAGTVVVDDSIVEGGWGGPGDGILDVDPLFVDAANHDLRLQPGSPAIDAGNTPRAAMHLGVLDLDGNPRTHDDPDSPNTGVSAFGEVIDMGPYEFGSAAPAVGACCLPNGCLVLSLDDCLAIGGLYYGDSTTCDDVTCDPPCPGDITGDGVVDVADVLAVIGAWGTCPGR